MNIPNLNTIQTPTFSQAKGIGGMNSYEGKDMGGGFYRRMHKPKEEESKQSVAEKSSSHKVDLVA